MLVWETKFIRKDRKGNVPIKQTERSTRKSKEKTIKVQTIWKESAKVQQIFKCRKKPGSKNCCNCQRPNFLMLYCNTLVLIGDFFPSISFFFFLIVIWNLTWNIYNGSTFSDFYTFKNVKINQFNISIDGSNRHFSILTKSNNFLSIQPRWKHVGIWVKIWKQS